MTEQNGTYSNGVHAQPFNVPVPNVALVKERRHTEFFDVIQSSLAITTPAQFCAWVRGDLQQIFPHGMMVCGIGEIKNQDASIQHILTSNFPSGYIQALQKPGGLSRSPVFVQWLNTRQPVLFEGTQATRSSDWLKNYKYYGLQNMAAHGLCDIKSNTTSYFIFAQIPGKLNTRHAHMLEMLTPHLHQALIRVLKGIAQKKPLANKTSLVSLTQRQYEILKLISVGQANWSIAQKLNVSENTVKVHVRHILAKLKVKTRAQAVAQGLF